jgi:hypothetical protein
MSEEPKKNTSFAIEIPIRQSEDDQPSQSPEILSESDEPPQSGKRPRAAKRNISYEDADWEDSEDEEPSRPPAKRQKEKHNYGQLINRLPRHKLESLLSNMIESTNNKKLKNMVEAELGCRKPNNGKSSADPKEKPKNLGGLQKLPSECISHFLGRR